MLRNIELLDGCWGPSLDILRRKTESRCLEGSCQVDMIRIGGSEFRQREYRWPGCDRWPGYLENWWDDKAKKPVPLGAAALLSWMN
ncbi:hypothetical protein IMZ48_11330 [Candidatus Bathyarchaeota archaeon]|nr:hypothetical protein [Candidatus Bathyarchaeota archaeon]